MSLPSYYAGLPRRARIFVNTVGGLAFLALIFHFSYPETAVGYWTHAPDAYLPDYLRDEYRAYGPEPLKVANRSARGVNCHWAAVIEESAKKIAPVPRVPEFPLLSAWLKPEA
ncbi:hypothetical protein FRC09_015177, partial [Ceratobasidium sp. 395]